MNRSYVIYEPRHSERERGWHTPLFDFDLCTRPTIDDENIEDWYPLAIVFVAGTHLAVPILVDLEKEFQHLADLLPEEEREHGLGSLRIYADNRRWTPIDVLEAPVSNDAPRIVWADHNRECWWR